MSNHIKKVYSLYASIYDTLFGKLFEHGRHTALKMMDIEPHDTILEVGVGTGLSLPLYPKGIKIIGIDLSEEMLMKAKAKKMKYALNNVHLSTMDASLMAFGDNTFHKVIASHVITVVPDPLRTLNEIKRVCKKDGYIFILNYAGIDNPLISRFEKIISPLRDKLGLGKHFDLNMLLQKACLSPISKQHVNILNACQIIKCRNNTTAENH
ncbi:MAG: class I SAM-dependent methyltransferase [Candidatus Kuenenia sp.]|nr:class I SAM-dependent methyltransferase [Candidatus Kuenenia hertensis]